MIQFAYEETAALSETTEALMQKACLAAQKSEGRQGDVTVLLTTPAGIQSLNREFRHVDAVTDVLSFPAVEGEAFLAPPDGYLGDIAICLERAAEQAEAYGHSLERELCFLTVHGMLHVLGYDHIDPEEERVMLKKQNEILETIGVTR